MKKQRMMKKPGMDGPMGGNVGIGVPVGNVFQGGVSMSVEGMIPSQSGVVFHGGIPVGVESMNVGGIPVSVGVGGHSMQVGMDGMNVGGIGIPVGNVGMNIHSTIDSSLVVQQMKEAPPPPPAP
jgi:hypothetical protein